MPVDFAPYQSDEPEIVRSKSPSPSTSPQRQISPDGRGKSRPIQPTRNISDILPSPSRFDGNDEQYFDDERAVNGRNLGDSERALGQRDVDVFETSLPLRMDYEAVLPYIALPPAGGVAVLLLEHKSDYVRFHAWQSSMLFTAIFILHLIFSFSKVLSWMLFTVDLLLIGWLSYRAYRDAETLDRCEVPLFGRLASSFVDDE